MFEYNVSKLQTLRKLRRAEASDIIYSSNLYVSGELFLSLSLFRYFSTIIRSSPKRSIDNVCLQLRGVLRLPAEQQFAQHHKGARGSRRRIPYVPKISDDGLPIAYHHLQCAQLSRRVQQQGKKTLIREFASVANAPMLIIHVYRALFAKFDAMLSKPLSHTAGRVSVYGR